MVSLGDRSYTVQVGSGLLDGLGETVAGLGADKAALVTHPGLRDLFAEAEASLRAAGLQVVTATMDEGEAAKSWTTVGVLLERFAGAEVHRNDVVVGLGGGVVTDTAGFCAAALLRGVRWVACPTTVLGALDAAVGGKTGVNLAAGKNLAGAFWQPSAVVVDTVAFAHLPERQVRSGLAEAAKYGFIADVDLLGILAGAEDLVNLRRDMEEVVARGVAVKAGVVAADEREAGVRAHLNYGHTVGHALEAACGYRLTHGEAISVGMVFAAELARLRGTLTGADVDLHRHVLGGLGLPTSAPAGELRAALAYLGRDKKFAGGPRFVLLDGLGGPAVVGDVAPAMVETALERVTSEVQER